MFRNHSMSAVAALFVAFIAISFIPGSAVRAGTFSIGTRNEDPYMQDIVDRMSNPNEPTEWEMRKFRMFQASNQENLSNRAALKQIVIPSNTPLASPLPSPPPLSICERKTEKSVFVYGKCPDVCLPFSEDMFVECGSLIQFGCIMKPCGPGNFACSLREELTQDVTICPGDKIIFEDVKLETLQRVSYKIDLKAPPVSTDLYLLSDATGSMGVAINAVKTKFLDLLNVFGARDNVAFGVGFYRDERELDNGFHNSQPISLDTDAARSAVNSLSARGGGDGDEANLVALYNVATLPSIGWRTRSRKILVYFGDWPGHEPTCLGSTRLTRQTVIDALNAKNITVIGVSFPPPGLDRAPNSFRGSCDFAGTASSGQGTDITTRTKGQLVSSGDQAMLIEAILLSVRRLSTTFDVDGSECEPNIDSVHNPALPITLESGDETTVTNTISLKPNVCSIVGNFECQYKYTESGADLLPTVIEFANIRGCSSS